MANKLLITGASGFLGWNLCRLAGDRWSVYGTYHSRPLSIPGVTLLPVDLGEFTEVQRLFQEVQPDAVIHAAALSSPNVCQNQPQESYRVNVTASEHIARLCAETDIPCAFTSSEQVFDGTAAPYREADPVRPINLYGEHKAMAEERMAAIYPKTAICRMPLMFGLVPSAAKSFIQPWLAALREGKELKLFVDEMRTPASGETAARGLLLAIANRVEGILHLGGRDRVSRYEFGQLMTQVFDLPEELLATSRQQDVPMSAPRPQDLTLDSSRAFALGYAPLPLREELEQLKGKV